MYSKKSEYVMRGTDMATTSELCKLLVFITSRESGLWNPGAKVIINTVHFGFKLNVGGVGEKKLSTTIQRTIVHRPSCNKSFF